MNNQNLTPQYIQHHDDEIDLKELFLALWRGKWIIILITFAFAGGGVLYALSQPNTYKAEAILASASDSKSGGLAAMASQFGGLASLAGISLGGGGTDSKAMALATLQSRQFLNAFVNKYDLLVPLMAGEKWNPAQDKLLINPEMYDEQQQQWVREVEPGKTAQPTDWDAYKEFKKILGVSESKDSGLVTLSITHLSPTIAKQWIDWLVVDLNAWIKDKSLDETRRNIQYLEDQIEKTNITDMKSVFYQLIEEQTKNLMLAEVQDEFAFKIIDPAVVPEEKVGPKRALICVLAVLLGGMLGMAIVLIRYAFAKKD
ncbi:MULTISPECIES: Wzz/FepE/Etk N-terminal domain-containing protein [Marinomonas]|uniref:LPS O-antigen length regulator n=1 Tax=Marinomonas arctica TaxID=383750 RepID=A0A7H1J483_9GAMM|nr:MULTISPECIES: Wzz/FepE/Etk N-terminal domain-containing protein [Marinomonas]MCS7488146.1 lipopolysaccharide biosynthesis protein [Marinomonas sp. BSi20414]QNT05299.1 LPS O-antigen length regulator [Marinomonas arctica]GGN37073.1 LPS biosynthesis protein [Marinomonas arctica]